MQKVVEVVVTKIKHTHTHTRARAQYSVSAAVSLITSQARWFIYSCKGRVCCAIRILYSSCSSGSLAKWSRMVINI